MGAFIDNESSDSTLSPYSHAAGYTKCKRTELVSCSDIRTDVMKLAGSNYNIPETNQYSDYKEMILEIKPDILNDIYHLFCLDDTENKVNHSFALINDYKTHCNSVYSI